MRPIKRLIQLEEALAMVLDKSVPVGRKEIVPLLRALGRVSAESVVSRVSVPSFNRAAMDGYAVRARDTFGASKMRPMVLKRIETLYAGGVPRKSLTKGSCAEIATGAMMPKGADAVVMVEDTESEGSKISISESVHPGKNVSKKSEDIAVGTKILSEGELLNPSKIGSLAAIGIPSLQVCMRPLIGIIPTGNEIAELGTRLRPGQVYNINSYTLASVVEENGAEARVLPVVDDTLESIRKVVAQNSDCDMLVFSGGSSVGERDIMLDVLEKEGQVLFHGVAVKPGKPTLFGTIGDQLVFGMPGYPTSCLSNAYLFLAPAIRRMARLPEKARPSVRAKMSKRVVTPTGRTQFLTVRLERGVAYPVFKESGAITSMAFADGYVVIAADVDLVEKGEEITVFLL